MYIYIYIYIERERERDTYSRQQPHPSAPAKHGLEKSPAHQEVPRPPDSQSEDLGKSGVRREPMLILEGRIPPGQRDVPEILDPGFSMGSRRVNRAQRSWCWNGGRYAWKPSSSNFSIRTFRAYPRTEIRQFSVEQFEATASQSTVPSPPLLVAASFELRSSSSSCRPGECAPSRSPPAKSRHRHRLNGYLDLAQRIPSLSFIASSSRSCLDSAVLKGMFPWRTRYPLS